MKSTPAIPLPILYRGFCVSDDTPDSTEIIVKHKRVRGHWVTGYYSYTQSDNKHWISDCSIGSQHEVLPETLGFLESESGHFCGDVCYYQGGCESVQGVVKFGKHRSQDGTKREDISFYIEWKGGSLSALMLRQDLLYWTKRDDIIWDGTMWDRKKKHPRQAQWIAPVPNTYRNS